tara:strand:- start:767 stop:1006 length:240 start_codon:yes stop_codon:yes gene_type:complete
MINKITKAFILNETIKVDPLASVQALYDIITNVRVSTKKDSNRMSLAKEHLRSIKRQIRSLNERVVKLEEELSLLNEDK